MALLLALVAVVVVAQPLFAQPDSLSAPLPRTQNADRSQARAQVYRSIMELELDHETGKLNSTDFAQLRAAALERAAALLEPRPITEPGIDRPGGDAAS
ncbi:MAG: hypothetical protein U0821_02335 [Chloroflexota bacterium]